MSKVKKISEKEFDDLTERYKRAKECRKQDNLEAEYACLKALFLILDTKDFKYLDFDSITFANRFEIQEIEVISEKFKAHKIIKSSDLVTQFRISPYAFVEFLHVNGAVNDRAPKKHHEAQPGERHLAVPKVGEYFLCPRSGFWRKATNTDVENMEQMRKEPLYMRFSDSTELPVGVTSEDPDHLGP